MSIDASAAHFPSYYMHGNSCRCQRLASKQAHARRATNEVYRWPPPPPPPPLGLGSVCHHATRKQNRHCGVSADLFWQALTAQHWPSDLAGSRGRNRLEAVQAGEKEECTTHCDAPCMSCKGWPIVKVEEILDYQLNLGPQVRALRRYKGHPDVTGVCSSC